MAVAAADRNRAAKATIRAKAAGRLVKPFGMSLPATFAYYLVCPEATAERPKIAAFRDWLLAEVSAS